MQLSDSDKEKVVQYLQSKWGQESKCPMCSVTSWVVNDRIFQVTEFDPAALIVGGPRQPLVSLVCTNCGYTAFINAIVAGVVKPTEEKPEAREGQASGGPAS